ncbi:flagellar protein FlaG [Variovorax sp. DT-64]|uniref:flagellar protein FlaG n=1 Tax=Variovorax sp. DT-64 TaxID=3396160 RepID=UPI003F1B4A8B
MAIPVAPAADNSPWWTQMLPVRRNAPAWDEQASAEAMDAATPVQVEQAVRELNASLQTRSVGLQFEVDEDTDKVIVKVVDRDSGELIRQIPSEEAVRIARMLDSAPGLLMDHSA